MFQHISKRFSAAVQLALCRTLELFADNANTSHVHRAARLLRAVARLLSVHGAHEHSVH